MLSSLISFSKNIFFFLSYLFSLLYLNGGPFPIHPVFLTLFSLFNLYIYRFYTPLFFLGVFLFVLFFLFVCFIVFYPYSLPSFLPFCLSFLTVNLASFLFSNPLFTGGHFYLGLQLSHIHSCSVPSLLCLVMLYFVHLCNGQHNMVGSKPQIRHPEKILYP